VPEEGERMVFPDSQAPCQRYAGGMLSMPRVSFCLAAVLSLTGLCPAFAAMPLQATTPPAVCTLVSGGLGTDFDDIGSRLVWSAVNRQVHEHLWQRLASSHHLVRPFFTEAGDAGAQRQAIHQAWLDSPCPLLVQVSHVVDEAAGEPFFGFDITVATLKGPNRRVDTLMNKRYRFARNKDSFENFRVAELVEDIVVLLAANGLIDASVTVGAVTPQALTAEYRRLKLADRRLSRRTPPIDQLKGLLVLRARDRLAAGLTPAGGSAARGTAGGH
jgi:hypothetical protein